MSLFKLPIVLSILMMMFITRIFSQVWVVPEDQKGMVSPFIFTPETVKAGEEIYMKNCKACHGIPGQNNFAKITPEPGDPVSEKFRKQTDGEFFYRITTGKTPMPTFGLVLSEDERWKVISYIRSFHPGYIQPKPAGKVAFTGKTIRLKIEYLADKKKIMITAYEMTKDKLELPFRGAEIVLYVKRYFGNLALGDPKTTNEKGNVRFDFPADLPGDKEGYVDLKALVKNASSQLSEAKVEARMKIGKPVNRPSLIATRAWWTVRSQAPVWIIFTYFLALILAWGWMLYIIYSVFFKMRKFKERNQ